MADQKRWFKVWTSILANANFAEMSLEDIGRWTLLGAATALDGDNGVLEVPGSGKELCRILRVNTLDEALDVVKRLHSVSVENRNGDSPVMATLTWVNWLKYQVDATNAARQKKWRDRNGLRREEKRGEEKREEERSNPPIPPRGGEGYSSDFLAFWEAYPRKVGKGAAWKAWQKQKPRPQLEEVLKALSWQAVSEDWKKDGGQFIPHPGTYLNQRRWEDECSREQPKLKPVPELSPEERLSKARERYNSQRPTGGAA